MRILLGIGLVMISTSAFSWDCKIWTSNVPGSECYKAPAAPAGTVTGKQSQHQAQGQTQGQKQSSNNSNVNKNSASSASKSSSGAVAVTGPSSSNSTAVTGPSLSSANTGPSTSAINETTSNSGNVTYREAANVVQPATMIIQGCQVQGQAGGSNTRAAGMLGIGFTPKNCYDYIQAQAYLAIGATQAACEVLNHTPAAERAVKAGAKLPDCTPPAPPAVVVAPPVYTQEQVDLIVKRMLRK